MELKGVSVDAVLFMKLANVLDESFKTFSSVAVKSTTDSLRGFCD
jgi:hypothetical protein